MILPADNRRDELEKEEEEDEDGKEGGGEDGEEDRLTHISSGTQRYPTFKTDRNLRGNIITVDLTIIIQFYPLGRGFDGPDLRKDIAPPVRSPA